MVCDPDDLASRYVELCLGKWTERQLPVGALASTLVVRGLELATHGEGPEGVAQGLERMADAVRRRGFPDAAAH